MTNVNSYLNRLREQYPMPWWFGVADAFGPALLPTPYTLDAVIRGGRLAEWRIVHDSLLRGHRSAGTESANAPTLEQLAARGNLAALGERIGDRTTRLDKSAYFRRSDDRLLRTAPWEDGLKQNVDVVRVSDLVDVGSPVLLTGPLGSGKSTFCRWYANSLAEAVLQGDGDLVPLYVDLRQAAPLLRALAMRDGVITMAEIAAVAVQVLGARGDEGSLVAAWDDGRAVLVVDGFDEIGVVLKQKDAMLLEQAIARTLDALASGIPRVVVSSRPGAAGLEGLTRFLHVELAPLASSEAARVMETFAGAQGEPERRLDSLVSAIPDELRTRPLFLALIGALAAEGKLPEVRTRWAILDASLRELLSARVAAKHNAEIEEVLRCDYDSLLAALQQLAFEAEMASVDKGGALSISKVELWEQVANRDEGADLTQVQHVLTREAGLLVPRDGRLEFVHRAFQDLLAAGHLADLADDGELRGDRDHVPLLEALRGAPHMMREVAELYVERQIGNGRVNHLLDLCVAALECSEANRHTTFGGTCVWLAALALREIADAGHKLDGRRDRPVIEGFVQAAPKYLTDPDILALGDRVTIAEQLGKWGDTRPGTGLGDDGVPVHDWLPVEGGEVWLGLSTEMAQNLQNSGVVVNGREIPQVCVTLDSFSVSRYTTTWAQYRAFLRADDGYLNTEWWKALGVREGDLGTATRHEYLLSRRVLDNAPVVGVDWFEAMAYCSWLSNRLRIDVGLPTEGEWEAAAKGRPATLFPWGEEFDAALANFAGAGVGVGVGVGRVIPVGCFRSHDQSGSEVPSDLIGNVWEWTTTIAGAAESKDVVDLSVADSTRVPTRPVRRIVRGGSYLNELPLLRSTYRGNDFATARFDRQGFRVLLRHAAEDAKS